MIYLSIKIKINLQGIMRAETLFRVDPKQVGVKPLYVKPKHKGYRQLLNLDRPKKKMVVESDDENDDFLEKLLKKEKEHKKKPKPQSKSSYRPQPKKEIQAPPVRTSEIPDASLNHQKQQRNQQEAIQQITPIQHQHSEQNEVNQQHQQSYIAGQMHEYDEQENKDRQFTKHKVSLGQLDPINEYIANRNQSSKGTPASTMNPRFDFGYKLLNPIVVRRTTKVLQSTNRILVDDDTQINPVIPRNFTVTAHPRSSIGFKALKQATKQQHSKPNLLNSRKVATNLKLKPSGSQPIIQHSIEPVHTFSFTPKINDPQQWGRLMIQSQFLKPMGRLKDRSKLFVNEQQQKMLLSNMRMMEK